MKSEREIAFNIYGYIITPVMLILTMITENKIIGWITVGLLSFLALALIGLFIWAISHSLFNSLSTIDSWSCEYDNEYYGYAIIANRSLMGFEWSTKEYLCNSKVEAVRVLEHKKQ